MHWHRIAHELKMPVFILKQTISFNEFNRWIEYFKKLDSKDSKLDMYLANILAEVRRSWCKHPKNIKAKDFIISYKDSNKTNEQRMSDSKTFWGALLMPHKNRIEKKKK